MLIYYNPKSTEDLSEKSLKSEIAKNSEIPKKSALYGYINLTNIEINNTRHYHNTVIPVYGRIFEVLNPSHGLPNYNVAISVDSVVDYGYLDKTDSDGKFQINYTIPLTMYIYASHRIEANIIDNTGPNDFEKLNHFTIYANATSYIQIDWLNTDDPLIPKLVGENFRVRGNLRYDDGNGIPNADMRRYWYNTTYIWNAGVFGKTTTLGRFSDNVLVPITPSNMLTLKMNFTTIPPYINYSQNTIYIRVFSNITCNWGIGTNASEGDEITISGEIVSNTDLNLKIRNRQVSIYYGGLLVGTTTTDNNGEFSYDYTIPIGSGYRSLQVFVSNALGKTLTSSAQIFVSTPTPEEVPPAEQKTPQQPFQLFFIVLAPIIGVIVVGLIIYARKYYRKQDIESSVVAVPLESKLHNLKILKDTGRLEESLSYLFNAVYMELISAKYGRSRKMNETIRDFSIVSVKELKLAPTSIYPFLQKIEEVIYARPFKIKDQDFYEAIKLFSPVYYELTGFNFILNF